MGSQRMRSQKFKRIQILHRCHLVFFCQIRHFVIHFRSMECKYRISLKIFFQSHFHMFPAAGSGSMRSQRPFHSWVVSVSPDQVPAPFQRFLCTGGVTGSIFHYGLPRNSTYSHLIHDMCYFFFKIIHIKNCGHTGKKQFTDTVSGRCCCQFGIHCLRLHRKQKYPQAVLAVISQSPERDHP